MENVLITGIGSGIGKGLAEKLLAEGSSVIGVDLSIPDCLLNIQNAYESKCFLRKMDLLETHKLSALIQNLVSEYGPLGGFVHCAGFDKMSPIHMNRIDDMEKLWKIHALAPMVMISSICNKKNHTKNASIVLISSQSAHEGAMGHTAYASAKGAIEGYLAPAAAELMERGIRINEVCLAPIKTPMFENWMKRLTGTGLQRLAESYPLGFGNVSDAVSLIEFLLSAKSSFINGQIIIADGGHSVRKV